MSDEMQYLSREWVKAQHDWLEGQYGDGSPGCGVGGWSGPCGGCIDCLHAQLRYGIEQERKAARVAHAAGFELLMPGIVSIDYKLGRAPYHDSWNCNMAKEREGYFFPWEKQP